MKKRWGKGDPVNLSDLLKITPVANEILQLSEELEISSTDVMWIVAQIVDNSEEMGHYSQSYEDEQTSAVDEWDELDFDSLEDEMDQSMYMVNVSINSNGRFPEIGFKAGINDKDDIGYFFDMVLEMLEKLE
ncbi:MAG: hypothetical protein PHT79_04530 [Syntrophomonadaceae bacterium]|nr:hypothetical protein [Syntrophomonadaceae bacterium]MDD3888867.1 hypothetical protein [Syntrophomonadaceae bacterium]MDD4549007.1 hypothetical protein [Syntrophomonadaceae bacterium]